MLVLLRAEPQFRERGKTMAVDREFSKVKHITVTEQVSEQIHEMITSGRFKPGDKLPSQKELEAMMGVSRPTLREAVSRLITLGIIEARQGKGYYVQEPMDISIAPMQISAEALQQRDLFEARLFLEAVLGQLAAVFASKEELEDLQRTQQRLDSGDLTFDDCAYGENHIHALIAKYAHNEFLSQFEYSILDHLQEYPDLFVSKKSTVLEKKYGTVPHNRIVDAICRRDPTAAYNESLQHILTYSDDIGLQKRYSFALLRENNA